MLEYGVLSIKEEKGDKVTVAGSDGIIRIMNISAKDAIEYRG